MKIMLFIWKLIWFLILMSSAGSTQTPQLAWQKSFGGSLSDVAYALQATSDGGYIVAGGSSSADGDVADPRGGTDFFVIRLNASGELLWQKSFGGMSNEFARVIRQTADGGFVVTGPVASGMPDVTGQHGKQDFWILRLDEAGSMVWQKCYGGSNDDVPYAMDLCHDGGFIIAGISYSTDGNVALSQGSGDYWIVRLDSTGALLWQKSLGGSAKDFAQAIVQSVDGGFLVSGYGRSNDGDVVGNHGQEDMWTIKLDGTGNTVWSKCYGGSGGEGASSIQQTGDGGYILLGVTHSNDRDVTGSNGQHEFWLVKINGNGDMEWTNCLGGPGTDNGNSLTKTADGGYLVAGLSDSDNGDVSENLGLQDVWVAKLDQAGEIIWQKSVGGSADEEAHEVIYKEDGSMVLAGWTSSADGDVSHHHGSTTTEDFWVVKLIECLETPLVLTAAGETEFCTGGSVTLQVAGGNGPIEWLRNGVPLAGATSSAYVASESGNYSCRYFSACGEVNSNTFPVTVHAIPGSSDALITAEGGTSICSGSGKTLSAFTAGMSYQWFRNDLPVSGSTGQSFIAMQAGTYTCLVSNSCGSVYSNALVISLNQKPAASISTDGSTSVCLGQSAVLQANTGSGLAYQWKKDGQFIDGSNSFKLQVNNTGSYRVLVTNRLTGCSKLSAATVVTTVPCHGSVEGVVSRVAIVPNPASTQATISFVLLAPSYLLAQVYSLSGEKVQTIMKGSLEAGSYQYVWDTRHDAGQWVPPGIYFLRISSAEQTITQKIFVAR